MGFYEDVEKKYGLETTQNLKKWRANNTKLAAARNRRIFLLECKRQGLVPKHMALNIESITTLFNNENKWLNGKIREFNEKTVRKILNMEIIQVNCKITRLESANKQIQDKVHTLQEMHKYMRRSNISYNEKFHKIKLINKKKIETLSCGRGKNEVKNQDR
ncbi:hypothetical protein WA026_023279 [Henosepilachna vigintioctopunctata]|uniref:Uncharacterized protein n=1 Tax=Henosepilachna vigintioctopunctata TaxID=420089 RepID=A0AAW1U4N5_9CUCU